MSDIKDIMYDLILETLNDYIESDTMTIEEAEVFSEAAYDEIYTESITEDELYDLYIESELYLEMTYDEFIKKHMIYKDGKPTNVLDVGNGRKVRLIDANKAIKLNSSKPDIEKRIKLTGQVEDSTPLIRFYSKNEKNKKHKAKLYMPDADDSLTNAYAAMTTKNYDEMDNMDNNSLHNHKNNHSIKIHGVNLDKKAKMSERDWEFTLQHEVGHIDDYSNLRNARRTKDILSAYSAKKVYDNLPESEKKEYLKQRKKAASDPSYKKSAAYKNYQEKIRGLLKDTSLDTDDQKRKRKYISDTETATKSIRKRAAMLNSHDNKHMEVKADKYAIDQLKKQGYSDKDIKAALTQKDRYKEMSDEDIKRGYVKMLKDANLDDDISNKIGSVASKIHKPAHAVNAMTTNQARYKNARDLYNSNNPDKKIKATAGEKAAKIAIGAAAVGAAAYGGKKLYDNIKAKKKRIAELNAKIAEEKEKLNSAKPQEKEAIEKRIKEYENALRQLK